MSSSKSIAAARNRRSGDLSGSQPSRPNKSINGNPSFSQQGPGRIMQQGPGQGQGQGQGPVTRNQPETHGAPVAITKLSVSDAIGLVTLRLGRLEQFMLDVQAEGGIHGQQTELPENTQLVDKSVITSIVNRLDSLEKRENVKATTVSNGVNLAQITKLENELKEVKDLLLTHMMKFEKHALKYESVVSENEQKFAAITADVSELFNNVGQINQDLDLNQSQFDSSNLILEENDKLNNTVATIDLKQSIKQELANASI
jgi:hypothetical protein